MMKHFHFTIDCDFIPNSNIVFDELMGFIDRNNLKPTFFLTGKFAEMYPDLSKELACKYEIGSHGLQHGLCPEESFSDKISYSEKCSILKESTQLIEKHTNVRPTIFRAPCLEMSNDTFRILKGLGYLIDSSIPSRRFDFFNGSINNLKFFRHSTLPLFLPNGIFEISPSSFVFPLNMRFLKIFGINTLLLFIELCFLNKSTIVFYMHPSELVENRKILDYPLEKDYFYKGGGLYLLKKVQRFINLLNKNGYKSTTMNENLEYHKNKLLVTHSKKNCADCANSEHYIIK